MAAALWAPVTARGGDITFSSGASSSSGSAAITVGTTTITGGTTTRILYDLAGVVQESTNATIVSGVPTFATFDLSAADTTFTRVSAGLAAVEGHTLAELDAAQSWSGNNTLTAGGIIANSNIGIYFGTGSLSDIVYDFDNTPKTLRIELPSSSNSIYVAEIGDAAYDYQNMDCGTSACTDPHIGIRSHNQTTTEWLSVYHNGTNGVIDVGAGVVSMPDGITTAGTLKGTSATGAGWTIGAAANQACNTTCQAQSGTPTCGFGFNVTAGSVTGLLLLCTDATADTCLCLG